MNPDITAIEQLLAEYCHQVDSGTPATVAALFHPQAVLKPYFDGRYEVSGRDEIRRWYSHYDAQFKSKIRHLKHQIGSAWIRVAGHAAQANSYFLVSYVGAADVQGVIVQGSYTDTLVHDGDGWQFMARQIDVGFAAQLPNATETFPSLGWSSAADAD